MADGRNQRFRVVVTYGTMRNATYADVPDFDAATKLRACARRLNYHDAEIVPYYPEDRYARPKREDDGESERGASDAAPPRGRGGRM